MLVQTQNSGFTYWVNVENVRYMQLQESGGTISTFDGSHQLSVETDIAELVNEANRRQ